MATAAPNRDQARKEMEDAFAQIAFGSTEWRAFECWLGWYQYDLSLAMIHEPESVSREKLAGQMYLTRKLLQFGESARKVAQQP
jgi:hypothetical protein